VKLFRQLTPWPASLRGGAVAIGNFDGVHQGHARIIERLVARARALAGPAIVFTFDPHPACLLRPAEVPPPLTTTDRKAQLLDRLGVDVVLAYPTDLALLRLSAAEFFQQIVLDELAARALVEGPNFFFGRHREGNVARLAELCQGHGLDLELVDPLLVDGSYVSSSRVRQLLLAGQVQLATSLLTAPHRVCGLVVPGAGRGANLGFPTANLEGVATLLPSPGVYAGRALVDGTAWPAAINLGDRPTFGESAAKFEVHLVGLDQPLYGRLLEVDFLDRVRDIVRFASVAELQAQLSRDVEAAVAAARREPAPAESG
jgi:riboflavin kinase/FMN adenylyltransferase